MCSAGETHHWGFAVHVWLHLWNEIEGEQVSQRLLNCIFLRRCSQSRRKCSRPVKMGRGWRWEGLSYWEGSHLAAEVFSLSCSHKNVNQDMELPVFDWNIPIWWLYPDILIPWFYYFPFFLICKVYLPLHCWIMYYLQSVGRIMFFDDELEAFFFSPPLTFWSPTTSTIVVFHLDWTKKLDSVKGLFMFLLPHKLSAVPLWIFLFISHKVGHEKLHLKDRTQISGGWRMGCRQGAAGNE